MPDTYGIFIKFFFIGGGITTSLYCFILYLARDRNRIFLGFGLLSFFASIILFSRRTLPLLLPAGGALWSDILAIFCVNGLAGGGLIYFFTFFGIGRNQKPFRALISAYSALSIAMIAAIALRFSVGGTAPMRCFYFAAGAFTLATLAFLCRNLWMRRKTLFSKNRALIYMGVVLSFAVTICIIKVILPRFNFETVLPSFYLVLVSFYILNGLEINREYHELKDLKNDLEMKVAARTNRIKELHEERQRLFLTMAHETKTPLTLVASCLDRYMESASPHPDLEIMKRALASLRSELSDHLDYERLISDACGFDHGQIFDAVSLLEEKAALFRAFAAKKGVALEIHGPYALQVSADPAAVGRIIDNLLENAVKYTSPGGRVRAELREGADAAILSVKDTGIGIPPALQERIFDPFYRASREEDGARGVGMGLAIVKKILEGLGGTIEVRSDPSKNREAGYSDPWITEITVSLPIRSPPARTDEEETVALSEILPPGRETDGTAIPGDDHDPARPTVLVVEDNPDFLAFLESSLERRYNAYGASNGSEAIAMIEGIPRPDIIVSDIRMPEMDGYAFFEALRSMPRYRDIPFIFLSAVSSPLHRLKSLSLGAIDFMIKPLASVAELEAKIVSLLTVLERRSDRAKAEVLERLNKAIAAERSDMPRQDSLMNENMVSFGLTVQERRIVECLREGMQNKEISACLGISTRTADNHIYHIFRKTGAQNRVELLSLLLEPR